MLPKDFIHLMTEQLGTTEAEELCNALESKESPTSIRINKSKTDKWQDDKNIDSEVPWCSEGFYLNTRPSFTFDPLLHAGCYYVQEASSMYLSKVLNTYLTDQPIVALDMCAAPGGKSTLTLSHLPEGSLLIANEVMRQRAQVLAENLCKWGNPNHIVTSNYAEDFLVLGQVFDLIICDAPCSGEGMFRKDQGAIDDWSLDNVNTCYKRQRDILKNIWKCLKPGGLLVYSTCTFNQMEDEANVEWISEELGGEILPIQDEKEWNITNGHFFPHKTKGEGFFISVFRKSANEQDECTNSNNGKNKKKKNDKQKAIVVPKEIKDWVIGQNKFTFFTEGNAFFCFPTTHYELFKTVRDNLKVVSAGIELASTKGKNLQPSHSLAVSTYLNNNSFPKAELTLEQAIAYLRTEAIQVDAEKGYVLLTFQGHPLGFGKNIGNRVNNLYPSEWRIRSTYTH